MSLIIDGSNGLTFPNSTTQASAGSVLQVVNATYGTETGSSSSTFADTGLTVSITPKFSTSKILVIVDMTGCLKQTNNTGLNLQVLRGSTTIATIASASGNTTTTTQNDFGSVSCNYLDSPATTSSTTYKVQFSSQSNNALVRICQNNSLSTITVMEIAQ